MVIVSESKVAELKKILKKYNFSGVGYVYTFKVPVNKVSIGNDSGHNEYTTREQNIIPTKIDEIHIDWKNFDKFVKIEGIQLFQWFNRDQFKSKPLIIKGTSMLTSSIRGNKRDFTENGKLNKVGMIKTLPQRLKWESEDERSLNRFKKEMKK